MRLRAERGRVPGGAPPTKCAELAGRALSCATLGVETRAEKLNQG